MKKLVMFRHGKKDGKMISAEGLKEAMELGRTLNRDVNCVVAGLLPRTWQTASAVLGGYMTQGKAPVRALTAIEEFGTDELFNSWIEKGFRAAVQKTGSNLEGVRGILSEQDFAEVKETARAGIYEVFHQMFDDELCVGFGHSPIIELAAEHYSLFGQNLQELQGVIFTLDNGGDITAKPMK